MIISRENNPIYRISKFEARELTGDDYNVIRESMVALKDAKTSLDSMVKEFRGYCSKAGLVNTKDSIRDPERLFELTH